MIKTVSILIITHNSADTLSRTVESVQKFAQEIIIIDDYSVDDTFYLAQKYGCRIVKHHFDNFGEQRAFALSKVATEWTLVLDSDEVLTFQNINEIEEAVQHSDYSGYVLRFRNHLFGKKLTHGELHKKLVLFKTKNAHIDKKEVHEQYKVRGKIGELSSEVLHYSYRSVKQIIQKFFVYSVLQAKQYKRNKKIYGVRELVFNPAHMFYERYIKEGGYKDGLQRLFLDYEFAHMEFLSYFLIPFVKEKKRVGIDCGNYTINGIVQSGIDRLIQGIISHKNNEDEYVEFGFSPDSSYRLPTRLYSQVWLPLWTVLKRCDIFLGTGGTIPYLLHHFPIKKILYLYDFGYFSSPEKYHSSAKKLQDQTEHSIRIANSIVILHNEIYKEFGKRYPQYIYKAVVISSGADHLINIKEKPVFIQPIKPIILYVGVVKPVKRVDKILSVIDTMYCIIVGHQEENYAQALHVGKTQRVQFIKNVNDNQLRWLYTHADVMVYTSEHEGFCYPVLEALTLGLPVIALNLAIFEEYQKYFPHLTLVNTSEEMRTKLLNVKNTKFPISKIHPYTWTAFCEKVRALWQPLRLPRQDNCKVAFIVVLYKTSRSEKKRLEQEIINIGLLSFSIYWVDNTASDKGYAAGINEGIRMGLVDNCNLFIALNPDISLKNITAENVVSVAETFDVWGFGMKQQNNIYYGGKIDMWRLSGGLIQSKPAFRYTAVDFVSGSLIGFSKHVIQTVGLWDESYFMYYEDADYCIRARKAGFNVGINTDILYDHFEISQINKYKEKWIKKSRWKYFWKYANWIQKMREIIRLPKTFLFE